MPFNVNTYRARRDERRARECMARARELRAEGASAERVAVEVKLARGWVRIARMERAVRDDYNLEAPACNGDPKCLTHRGGKFDLEGKRECRR